MLGYSWLAPDGHHRHDNIMVWIWYAMVEADQHEITGRPHHLDYDVSEKGYEGSGRARWQEQYWGRRN